MTEADLYDIAREALWVIIKIAAPILLTALFVGLVIALFQSLTQIQEMSLTFVPKMLVTFVTLVLFLPFMLHTLMDFAQKIIDRVIAGG